MPTKFMTAHRAQGLTVYPPLCRTFVSPPWDAVVFSTSAKVARLLQAVDDVGGVYKIVAADSDTEEQRQRRQKKLRIYVPSEALLTLVESLLPMDRRNEMRIYADDNVAEVLARIIVDAGSSEVPGQRHCNSARLSWFRENFHAPNTAASCPNGIPRHPHLYIEALSYNHASAVAMYMSYALSTAMYANDASHSGSQKNVKIPPQSIPPQSLFVDDHEHPQPYRADAKQNPSTGKEACTSRSRLQHRDWRRAQVVDDFAPAAVVNYADQHRCEHEVHVGNGFLPAIHCQQPLDHDWHVSVADADFQCMAPYISNIGVRQGRPSPGAFYRPYES
ncbi:hypothetical protein FPV67DRAFT_1460966 [Lyophyllum atratum]|nr:hypothetical protein FPV67DRAFT_1460966 [Lyophyllum atratum]